jgi:hypothetical protein
VHIKHFQVPHSTIGKPLFCGLILALLTAGSARRSWELIPVSHLP